MQKQLEKLQEKYSKYEISRIIGARALQLAMDAPILKKLSKEELEAVKYDPLKIAEIELVSDVLPITVKRPLPKKIEEKKVEKTPEELEEERKKKEEEERKKKIAEEEKEAEDKKILGKEKKEEEEIMEEGEIMQLAKPEDEVEEEPEAEGGEGEGEVE